MSAGRRRVRRPRGESSEINFAIERHIHRIVGVMVWGAIGYGSRSPLIYVYVLYMTAVRYIDDVLQPGSLPYIEYLQNVLF